MNYKGIVTDCNPRLCHFTLDDIITVYAGYNFINKTVKLPQINEEIIITEGQLYDSKYIFLTVDTKIISYKYCDENENAKSAILVNTISDFKLGAADLLSITHHVQNLNKLGTLSLDYLHEILGLPDISSEEIILKIVPHISKAWESDASIFNEIIPFTQISTPSKFKINKNAKKLVSGCYWTFGVNSNEEQESLIGYLHLSDKLGFTVFADKNYFLVCIIVPDELSNFSNQMQHILNKLVLIKKYKVFTEMFKDIDIIQYVYFNVKDVKVIDLNYHDETVNTNDNNSFEFDLSILHRSSLVFQDPQFYCLIHCNVRSRLMNEEYECLLKLKGNNLKKYPFINDGDEYKLIFPEASAGIEKEFKEVEGKFIQDVVGMKCNLKSFSLPARVTVMLEPGQNQNVKLLSVKEAVSLLKAGHEQLISFEGIVVQKRFIEPLPSRMKNPVKNIAFGTAGNKIHQIILKNCRKSNNDLVNEEDANLFEDNGSENNGNIEEIYENNYVTSRKETLAYVYLYYWEKMHCPLGIIPDMRVAVKYFYPQNGSYFKPTNLSVIQPLQYEPIFDFNTCHELQDNSNWGPMCYLGNGEGVPTDCVCWGPTESIKIANLTIHHTCSICGTKIYDNQIQCCEKSDYDMNLMLVITIRDRSGNADVLTKSHDVFRILMGYDDEQWTFFKEAMKKIAYFVYSPTQDDIQDNILDKFIRFTKLLYLQINIWNSTEIHTLDLKCRKLDKSFRDIPSTPKWYCLEARKTEMR